MPCPVDTTLQFAKICGSVQEICPVGDPQNLRVTIDLVNPSGGALTDPTTDAFVVGGRIFDDLIIDSTDGCWCTCDLLVNTAADPAMSLQPNNTAYKITVRWGTTTVIDGLQFQLDADTIGNFTLDTNAECGDCINISDLVEIPVLPPAATFCDQVDACVVDLQAQADANTAGVATNAADIAALVDNDTTNAAVELTLDATGLTATVTDSAGNDVSSAPVLLTTTTTVVGVEGDTFPYDTTLPDGSTLTAGDPVPAGVAIIAEQNSDGTLNAEAAIETDSGCCVQTELCDSANNDAPVIILSTIASDGTVTLVDRLNKVDLTTFAGNVADLVDCAAADVDVDVIGDDNRVIDLAAERFPTIEQEVADSIYHAYPFVDSGDGCTPANRGGALDQGGIVHAPHGYVWEYAPGAAAPTKVSGPVIWIQEDGETGIFPEWNPAGAANTLEDVTPVQTVSIPNPTCDTVDVLVLASAHAEINLSPNIGIFMRLNADVGTPAVTERYHQLWRDPTNAAALTKRDSYFEAFAAQIPPGGADLNIQMVGFWTPQGGATLTGNEGIESPILYWSVWGGGVRIV